MTTAGVELNECSECRSVWFDRGEILFFVKDMRAFDAALDRSLEAAPVSELRSPRSPEPMHELRLADGRAPIHRDPVTGGVWLSSSAVQALRNNGELNLAWHDGSSKGNVVRFVMPNLIGRTVFTLAGLYGMLSLVLIAISLLGGFSAATALLIAVAVAAFQFAIGPFFMDLMLRFIYRARKEPFEKLPENLREFADETCERHGMKVPQFWIIEDLAPNAFVYGHTPNNARLVLTEGMFELLEEDELFGVVGHELGHARNWDMALMTVAQLVPMLLYYIYRTALRVDTDDERAKAASTAVAIGAFLLYIFAEYVVLWFSRTREYYADRFGAETVGSPAALGRALIKIAYGLAGRPGPDSGEETGKQPNGRAAAVGALGIFDAGAAQAMAVVTQGVPTERAKSTGAPRYRIDAVDIKGAMKWDLWNPWAAWFELHSTHPLVAKRLLHLSELSREMGEEPVVEFDLPRPESYWDEFALDVAVMIAPTVLLIAGSVTLVIAGASQAGFGALLMAVSAAMCGKLLFKYPTGRYPDMSVATLLRQVKVSYIRPVPCRLSGTVRGKGVPGLLWSDDFVLQDDTGIMFLDHRQPLAIWEMIWGWLRGDKIVGGKVEVEGWYRRAPVPFVEIARFTVDGKTRTSWLRHVRWLQALAVGVGGALLVVLPMVSG